MSKFATRRGVPLYSAEETRELDRLACQLEGVSGHSLMNRAGTVVFGRLVTRWSGIRNLHVVCGTGSNGGDGWVVARCAKEAGFNVIVELVGMETRIYGNARQAMYDYLESGGEFRQLKDGDGFEPKDACLVVDAMMGTGFRGSLSEQQVSVVERINACGAPVIAIDCPSGLNPDSGAACPIAVRADVTVTFIGRNRGLFTGEAAEFTGDVVFEDLDVPEAVFREVAPSAEILEFSACMATLQQRKTNSHKGHFGHVLVVGGNRGMGGAGILAAEAALRAGAGLVSLATHPDTVHPALARRPEIMARPIVHSQDLAPLLASADVVVAGPGLGADTWAQSLLGRVLDCHLPVVIDADGLNLIAEGSMALARKHDTVITPHPGEAARLLKTDTRSINSDRFSSVRALANQFESIAVLKGAGTLIASPNPEQPIALSNLGNPGMASGGMGDLLAGIIGALMAQGLSPEDAACLGVCVHGRAGDVAATAGKRGLLASDLLEPLRHLLH